MPQHPPRNKPSYRACRKWKSRTVHTSKHISSLVICKHKGWGFPNYPGIRTKKKKRLAQATHLSIKADVSFPPAVYTALHCTLSVSPVSSRPTACKVNKDGPLLCASPTPRISCHPVVWTTVAWEDRTVLEINWSSRGFEPPIAVKRLATMDITKNNRGW